MTTYERVTNIIADVFGIPLETITPSSTISELAPNMDSLNRIEIVIALEEEFDCDEFESEEIQEEAESRFWKDVTVQEIVDYIDQKRK